MVGRENDPDWYEACNPLLGTRGLVPVKYFEGVGKTVRDSRGSTNSASSTTHDSGYAEGATPRNHMFSGTTVVSNGSATQEQQPQRMSRSSGKPGGASVYGIVSYDFKAERPDELDAKEGEAIIVIAQSNPEWFVAKPITRLGGPGLIPVSFIEIKDMHTGQTVADPAEAIARAGIPKVEEWKKMAADYKNTSIPLGQIGSQAQEPPRNHDGLAQGMDRMSLGGGQASNGYGYGHSRTPSSYMQQTQQYPIAPIAASCTEYLFEDDKFHFIVEAELANGSHWVLKRIYEDFYELQINLIKAFPEEAGQTGLPRTLPFMPGPVQFVTDKISEGRRENLDEYLRNLLRLGPHITTCSLVRNFFTPREGDFEVDGNADSGNPQARYSQASRDSHYANQAYQQHSRQSSQYQAQHHQHHPSSGHQRQQPSMGQNSISGTSKSGHYRTPSQYTTQSLVPPMQRQTTQTSGTGSSSSVAQALKVKVWFDKDTCVVIRMPPRNQFGFEDLYRKIIERRRLEYNKKDADENYGDDERLCFEYRDEASGEYYRLEGDDDLEVAVDRNEKLTLVVRELDE